MEPCSGWNPGRGRHRDGNQEAHPDSSLGLELTSGQGAGRLFPAGGETWRCLPKWYRQGVMYPFICPIAWQRPPDTVLGARDVEMRKAWCLWDGPILLKSRDMWVPSCLGGLTIQNKPSKGFQGNEYHDEKGPKTHWFPEGRGDQRKQGNREGERLLGDGRALGLAAGIEPLTCPILSSYLCWTLWGELNMQQWRVHSCFTL